MKKLLAAAAAVIMSCTLFGCGKSSEVQYASKTLDETTVKPITDYFDGFNENDPELVINAIHPGAALDKMKEEGSYDEQLEDVRLLIEDTKQFWEENYGANCTLGATSNFIGTKMTDYEVACAKNYFTASYGEELEFSIEDGYAVSFDFCVKGDSDKLEGKQEACLIKMKGDDWMMIMAGVDALIANYSGAEVNLGGNENGE